MAFEIYSLKEIDLWNQALKKLPVEQQDIYYTPDYYRIYEEYGDGEAFCFVYHEGDKLAVYPFLKNSVNNVVRNFESNYYDIQGAYGYNGVVSSSYDENFINAFYAAFNDFCQKENIIAEFSRFHPLLDNYKFSENHLQVFKDRQTVYLDISKPIDDIWLTEFSSKNRNMIRKAEKSGLKFRLGKSEEDYLTFRTMYIETMEAVNAKKYYFFDEAYFLNFKNLPDNKQSLLLAEFEGKIIAGLLLMLEGKYAHYHLSARLRAYGKYAANNFLLEKAIRIAQEQSAELFHFGGGNSTKNDDPLFKFKANFSKSRADFYIGKKIHNKQVYEALCSAWEKQHPELKDKYKNFLLKYRESN